MNTKQIVALATIISMVTVPVFAGDLTSALNPSAKHQTENATNTSTTPKSTEVKPTEVKPTDVETTKRGILNIMFKNEDGSYNWIKTGAIVAALGTGCYFGSDYIKGAGSYIKGLGTTGLDKVKSLFSKTAEIAAENTEVVTQEVAKKGLFSQMFK